MASFKNTTSSSSATAAAAAAMQFGFPATRRRMAAWTTSTRTWRGSGGGGGGGGGKRFQTNSSASHGGGGRSTVAAQRVNGRSTTWPRFQSTSTTTTTSTPARSSSTAMRSTTLTSLSTPTTSFDAWSTSPAAAAVRLQTTTADRLVGGERTATRGRRPEASNESGNVSTKRQPAAANAFAVGAASRPVDVASRADVVAVDRRQTTIGRPGGGANAQVSSSSSSSSTTTTTSFGKFQSSTVASELSTDYVGRMPSSIPLSPTSSPLSSSSLSSSTLFDKQQAAKTPSTTRPYHDVGVVAVINISEVDSSTTMTRDVVTSASEQFLLDAAAAAEDLPNGAAPSVPETKTPSTTTSPSVVWVLATTTSPSNTIRSTADVSKIVDRANEFSNIGDSSRGRTTTAATAGVNRSTNSSQNRPNDVTTAATAAVAGWTTVIVAADGRDVNDVGELTSSSGVGGGGGGPALSGEIIAVAVGCILVFWIILGPVVCLFVRSKDKANEKRRQMKNKRTAALASAVGRAAAAAGGGGDLDPTAAVSPAVLEEIRRIELLARGCRGGSGEDNRLARGRDKLYQTAVHDSREIERLPTTMTTTTTMGEEIFRRNQRNSKDALPPPTSPWRTIERLQRSVDSLYKSPETPSTAVQSPTSPTAETSISAAEQEEEGGGAEDSSADNGGREDRRRSGSFAGMRSLDRRVRGGGTFDNRTRTPDVSRRKTSFRRFNVSESLDGVSRYATPPYCGTPSSSSFDSGGHRYRRVAATNASALSPPPPPTVQRAYIYPPSRSVTVDCGHVQAAATAAAEMMNQGSCGSPATFFQHFPSSSQHRSNLRGVSSFYALQMMARSGGGGVTTASPGGVPPLPPLRSANSSDMLAARNHQNARGTPPSFAAAGVSSPPPLAPGRSSTNFDGGGVGSGGGRSMTKRFPMMGQSSLLHGSGSRVGSVSDGLCRSETLQRRLAPTQAVAAAPATAAKEFLWKYDPIQVMSDRRSTDRADGSSDQYRSELRDSTV